MCPPHKLAMYIHFIVLQSLYMHTHAYMYTVHMGWSAGQALIIAKGRLSPVTQGYLKLSTTCTCTHSDYVGGRVGGCVCGEGGGGREGGGA